MRAVTDYALNKKAIRHYMVEHDMSQRQLAKMCHGVGVLDSDVLNALDIGCGGTDGVSSAYDVEKLADLIDCPTCRIIKSAKIYTAFGELIDTMNVYVLSCGHQAVGFEKPDYCPKCGTRVGR